MQDNAWMLVETDPLFLVVFETFSELSQSNNLKRTGNKSVSTLRLRTAKNKDHFNNLYNLARTAGVVARNFFIDACQLRVPHPDNGSGPNNQGDVKKSKGFQTVLHLLESDARRALRRQYDQMFPHFIIQEEERAPPFRRNCVIVARVDDNFHLYHINTTIGWQRRKTLQGNVTVTCVGMRLLGERNAPKWQEIKQLLLRAETLGYRVRPGLGLEEGFSDLRLQDKKDDDENEGNEDHRDDDDEGEGDEDHRDEDDEGEGDEDDEDEDDEGEGDEDHRDDDDENEGNEDHRDDDDEGEGDEDDEDDDDEGEGDEDHRDDDDENEGNEDHRDDDDEGEGDEDDEDEDDEGEGDEDHRDDDDENEGNEDHDDHA